MDRSIDLAVQHMEDLQTSLGLDQVPLSTYNYINNIHISASIITKIDTALQLFLLETCFKDCISGEALGSGEWFG